MTPPAPSISSLRQHVEEAVEAIRSEAERVPAVAVIAESGLAPLAGTLDGATRLPLEDGGENVLLGTLEGVPVALVEARPLGHGFTAQDVAFPVRVLASLGTEAFILLGSAIGLDSGPQPGSVMLLTDHLNLTGTTPLTGANEDDWGPRFPDMTAPYDADWRAAVHEAASTTLHDGIYAAVPGSTTPAEQTMLRRMGADAVGIGLVSEVLAARHMERRVLAAVQIAGASSQGAEEGAMATLAGTAVRQAGRAQET